MKKTLLISSIVLSVVVLFSACVNANSNVESKENKEGIFFHSGTWEQALEKARKENKLIFFDANTSWCPPCKRMERRTFPDPEVGKYFNSNFINVKMDMEKGEGIALSKKFPIPGYPTLFFIDGTEKIVAQQSGGLNPSQLLAYAKATLNTQPE